MNSYDLSKSIQDHMRSDHNRTLYGPYITKIPSEMITYPDWRLDVAFHPELIDDLAAGLHEFYARISPLNRKIELSLHSQTAIWNQTHLNYPKIHNLEITGLALTKNNCFVYYKSAELSKSTEQKVQLSPNMLSDYFGIVDTLSEFLCKKSDKFREQYNKILQESVKNLNISIKYCNPNYCIPVIYYSQSNEDAHISGKAPSKPLLHHYDLSDLTVPNSASTKKSPLTSPELITILGYLLLSSGLILRKTTCYVLEKVSPKSYKKATRPITQFVNKAKRGIQYLFENGRDRTQ